ncbi:MAG: HEAT repeat domain-containing protein [Planctomycetota bacterium]|nr:HEAT repeat domain-containing protein [Planctomycetota bacterium]
MVGPNDLVLRLSLSLVLVGLLAGCGEQTVAAPVDGQTQRQWMLELEQLSPSTKAKAVEALGRFTDPPLDVIASHVEDPSRSVRVAAVRALGHVGPAAVAHAPALATFLESTPEGPDARSAKALRNAAMDALGALGPDAFKSFSHLLVSESPALRARAVYTLRPFVRELKDGVNTVMPLMKDEHAVVRREATKSLGAAAEGTQDRRASEALVSALGDPDGNVADAAAIALGSVGGSADREGKALADLLYNHRQSTRASAAFGLGLMGPEAEPYLRQITDLLKNDNRRVVRIQAARAHFRISGSADVALEQLEKDVQCGDTGLCRDAIKAIGEMGPAGAPAVNSLITFLDQAAMRGVAAEALGAMGPAAAGALPHLDRAATAAGEDGPGRPEIDQARSLIRGD